MTTEHKEGLHKVLGLNSTFTPINITSWRSAMTLLYKGKARGVEYNGHFINGKFLRKGDRALEETGMKLNGVPYRPSSTLYLYLTRLLNIPQSWYNYFFKNN